ncbi:MAG: hypothetical protein AMXMBFR13_16850 [Phycisphaerae bacterium]
MHLQAARPGEAVYRQASVRDRPDQPQKDGRGAACGGKPTEGTLEERLPGTLSAKHELALAVPSERRFQPPRGGRE